jgi:hypothetical protein
MGDYPFGPGVSGSAYQPWQFHVPPLGGGDDDVPDLNAAINVATAYALNNQGLAEVVVDPALYTLSSALSTAGGGYAQLFYPLVGDGFSSPIVTIRCLSGNGAANPYFAQTVPQASGAVFRSTLTGQAYSGTFGSPAILGGPTAEQGYGEGTGVFNNMMAVIDGITFQPQFESSGPTVAGAWLAGMAKAQVISGAYMPDATLTSMSGTQPVNTWANGLYMPQPLNNDNCVVTNWTAYGAYRGLVGTSHTAVHAARSVYCNRAFSMLLAADGHSFTAQNLSAELCNWALYAEDGSVAHPTGISIGTLDCEQLSHYSSGGHVNDGNNVLGGRVSVNQFDGGALAVVGGANLEIIATAQARGFVGPPGVPLTTVPLANPYYRHATVYVTGSTVTAIAVNGTATGQVPGAGTAAVRVPSGATITLAYATGSPSWAWDLD